MTGLQPAIWPTTTNSRMSGQSGKFGDALWTVLQQLFGLLFALTLAWGILAFPIYKNMSTGYVPVAVGLLLVLMIYGRRASTWIGEVLARPNVRSFVIFVVAVGVAVRMAAVLSLRAQPLSDHACYNELALKLYHGQQLGPTAYFPPGMVFWLLLIYSIFGESLLAVQLVNALVGGLFVWLTYDVGRRVVGDRAARLAALISAVFPSLVLYTTTLGYGPLLGCVLLSAISLFLRRGPPSGHPWWYVAVIGVILGLACLVKPIGLVLPLVIGLCYWRRQTPVLRAARNTAILVVSLSVVISPWAIRNYLVFGKYVPVTTSGGVAIWITNHPNASVLSVEPPQFPPGTTEVERNRALRRAAQAYILSDPTHIFRQLPAKAAYMWGTSTSIMAFISADRMSPHVEAAAKLCINTAWTFVCAFFIIAILRDGLCRSVVAFWPLVCLLAYLWGIHLFYEAQSKYHLPLLPVLFIGAASAIIRRPVGDGTHTSHSDTSPESES